MSSHLEVDFPDSPVLPQLSVTLEELIDVRSKHTSQNTVETEGDKKTPKPRVDNDQLKIFSSSNPERFQSGSRTGFLQRRLVRSIDLNCIRVCKTTSTPAASTTSNLRSNQEACNSQQPEVGTTPDLGRLSLHHPCKEAGDGIEDVANAESKSPGSLKFNPSVSSEKPRAPNRGQFVDQATVEEKIGIGAAFSDGANICKQEGRVESSHSTEGQIATFAVQPNEAPVEPRAMRTQSTVLTVNGKDYTLMRELGKGGSSTVFEVYDANLRLLAIKSVDLSCADMSVRDSYLNEINMLRQLQGSSRIIKLYDHEYNREQKRLYVVMERGDVDLSTVIAQRVKQGGITPEMIKFYWSEMLRAVQEIHSAGIIHSDLKPANFLLVAGQLKLIDFGIASAIPDDKTSIIKDTKCGTPSYMSPEALMDIQCSSVEDGEGASGVKIKLGVKSDVWSLGCILYHMVYGGTPFQRLGNNLKLQAIVNPTFQIDFPPLKDKLLLDVLKCCIVRDSKQRASVEELLKHPFLTASTLLDCLNELSPISMAKVSKVLEQFQNQRS